MAGNNIGRKPFLDFATKHFIKPGADALAPHWNRLSQYFVRRNTVAEELPSTTKHFSIVDRQGTTWFPSPRIVETQRTGKVGTFHQPTELGGGYVGFKPHHTKPDDKHFVGTRKRFESL